MVPSATGFKILTFPPDSQADHAHPTMEVLLKPLVILRPLNEWMPPGAFDPGLKQIHLLLGIFLSEFQACAFLRRLLPQQIGTHPLVILLAKVILAGMAGEQGIHNTHDSSGLFQDWRKLIR